MSKEELVAQFEKELRSLKEQFQRELGEIRGHRPTLSLVENIEVEAYQKRMPLKSLGNLTIDQEGAIFFYPWDPGILEEVMRQLLQSNIGASVKREENFLVITFPPLSEENKLQLLKLVAQKKERTRERARKTRDEILREGRRELEEGRITEDESFALREEVDKKIKEFNVELDKIAAQKEAEIKG